MSCLGLQHFILEDRRERSVRDAEPPLSESVRGPFYLRQRWTTVPGTFFETDASRDDGSRKSTALADGAPLTVRNLFREHSAYVVQTIRHFGVAEADVPDVCQEVFFTIHRKLAGFEGRSGIRTWLYGICLRVCADHRRRAYIRKERATAEPVTENGEWSGDEPDSQVERRFALRALLDGLDPAKREIVILYEIEGLSMKEVAERVGCTVQTAYSRLHAARECLLRALAR